MTSATRPFRALLGALIAMTLVVLAAPPAVASASDESSFVTKLNAERTGRGLPALSVAADLISVARAHSAEMARTNNLHHNPSLTTQVKDWIDLGENVGYGASVDVIHNALMNSPSHRANILGSQYKQVGIGIAISGTRMWVTQVFRNPTAAAANRGTGVQGYRAPFGSFDSATRSPQGVTVRGWTIDPDTASPTDVHVYVDGRLAAMTVANGERADVGNAYPAYGSRHGYSVAVPMGEGAHTVCVYALDYEKRADNPIVACRRVDVRTAPIATLDGTTRVPGGLDMRGWTLDLDTVAPTELHAYVDGRLVAIRQAGLHRGDIAAAFPGYGPEHGFNERIPVPAGMGTRQVCLYAIDAPTRSNNPLVSCRSVNGRPFGTLDSVVPEAGKVTINGWALDPDSTSPLRVNIWVDGRAVGSGTGDRARNDVAAAYPGYGSTRGFSVAAAAGPGAHTVCAELVDSTGAASALMACKIVTVQ